MSVIDGFTMPAAMRSHVLTRICSMTLDPTRMVQELLRGSMSWLAALY